MIAVRDINAASNWYQQVLGFEWGKAADGYQALLLGGEVVLQLQCGQTDRYPYLVVPGNESRGHGVVLWFETPYFDDAAARARENGAEILEPVHYNGQAHHREILLRDLEGHVIVLASPYGDLGDMKVPVHTHRNGCYE